MATIWQKEDPKSGKKPEGMSSESEETDDLFDDDLQKPNDKKKLIKSLEKKAFSRENSVIKLQKETGKDLEYAKAAYQASFGNSAKAYNWLGYAVRPALIKRQSILFDRHTKFFLKSATVLKLQTYFDEITSKASVQATSSLVVDECMEWAKKNKMDHGRIKSLAHEYDLEFHLLWKTDKVRLLVTKHGLKFDEAKAAVYKAGEKKRDECLKWADENKTNYGAIMIYSKLYEQEIENKLIGDVAEREEQEMTSTMAGLTLSDMEKSNNENVTRLGKEIKDSLPQIKVSKKVGVDGGIIDISGNKIKIPCGALNKDTDLEITLDYETDNVVDIGFPITPIVRCTPHVEFDKPVNVGLYSCYSAIGLNNIPVTVFNRKDVASNWMEAEKLYLGRKNYINFDVTHFSDDVVTVSEENCELGELHLINDVFIQKDTSYIASIFFIDYAFYEATRRDLLHRNIKQILISEKEIITKMDTEINLRIECKRPVETKVTSCTGQSSSGDHTVCITPVLLKQRKHVVYFTFDPELDNYAGRIDMRYFCKVGAEEDVTPLGTTWPIVEKKPVPNINIDASQKAHVIAGGDASVSSQNSVHHIG